MIFPTIDTFVGSRDVGGKASALTTLARAGLPVPAGFVIPAPIERDGPHFAEALTEAASQLAWPLIARSSATVEDQLGMSSAGLFDSVADLDTPEALVAAVSTVVESAKSSATATYLKLMGHSAPVLVSVVVQEQVASTANGVVYTRPPGHPDRDEMLVEVDTPTGTVEAVSTTRTPSTHPACLPSLSPEQLANICRYALAAEAALGAHAGCDVEWVADGEGRIWLVQARPIVHNASSAGLTPPASLFGFSRTDPKTTWSWDVTHNPDPLSPAQAGLVNRVRCAHPLAGDMRVVEGYLYCSQGQLSAEAPTSVAELDARYSVLAIAARRCVARPAGSVTDSLAGYDECLGHYAEVGALLRAAKSPLRALLAQLDVMDEEHRLTADARMVTLPELRDMPTAWDVAAPVVRTDAGAVHSPTEEAAAARVLNRLCELHPSYRVRLQGAVVLSRRAHALSEMDDALFYAAQQHVRRALLNAAQGLPLEHPGDVFFLHPGDVADWEARGEPPAAPNLRRAVATARANRERQKQWRMPIEVRGGHTRFIPRRSSALYRGRGAGGTASGKLTTITDLTAPLPDVEGCIVMVRAIPAGLVVAVRGAAAIIATHEGLLGHGPAIARQLGVPCIVDCPAAWSELGSGDRVWVSGASGLIIVRERADAPAA